jgi:leucyl aminopeptidase (aminopeptidase T)
LRALVVEITLREGRNAPPDIKLRVHKDVRGAVAPARTSFLRTAEEAAPSPSARNPYEFGDIPAERLAAHRRAMGKVSAKRNELERWVLVRVPNEAFAQQAGLSLDETMAFFFDAALRNWERESERLRLPRVHLLVVVGFGNVS